MASFISPICHSPEEDYCHTPMAKLAILALQSAPYLLCSSVTA